MKTAYPTILTPTTKGYLVYVPDLEINTEGDTLEEALDMAADAIGLLGITLQDAGKGIPQPASELPACADGDMTTFVLVDFDAYRRANDMRTVRKNVTIPNYLNELAEKAAINFSQVLQEGLRQKLGIQ